MNTPVTNDQGSVVVNNIREEMRILSQWLQPFLTWLTGIPLIGQQPLIKRTNLSHLFTAYGCLLLGMYISCQSQTKSLYGFMPIGFLITVSGARKISTVINHFLVHKDFFSDQVMRKYPRLNNVLGEINQGVLFLQSFESYIKEHLEHHTIKIMASILDPDMAFLFALRFRPGMRKSILWVNFIINIVFPISPLHCLFIWARVKATFTGMTFLRAIVQLTVITSVFIVAHYTSFWTIFWMWIFPIFYLYHIAAIGQFLSEHYWAFEVECDGRIDPNKKTKELHVRSISITVGRPCGTPTPQTNGKPIVSRILLWVKWWLTMLLIHLPIRLFVLPGDLICHDWHHRGRRKDDWANPFYARAAFKANLDVEEQPLIEIWGLHNAIDAIFEHLSKMPPIIPTVKIDQVEMVLGM